MTSYAATILPPRESRGLPRWIIAALVVLVVHLAVGIWLVLKRVEEPAGTPSEAVMIELAPVVASAAQQPVAAPPQETAPALTQQPPLPTELTTPQPPPPPQVTPPPPRPVPQTAPETPPTMTTPAPATLPIPPITPVPEIQAPEPEAVIPLPQPAPEKTQEEKKLEQQKRIEEERREKAEEQAEHRKERAERARAATRASRAARAADRAPGASRVSSSAWASLVQARVNAAKRYPESARTRGESGAATLAFTVDADGRVVAARVVGSSGFSDLDRETVSMAYRLGRLPPPPNGRVTLRVRVNFSVR